MGAGLSRGSAAGRWYGPAPHASRPLRVPAGPAAPALDPRVPAGPGQAKTADGAARVGPLMSRVDLVRGLPRLGPRCRRPPLSGGGLAAAPAGPDLERDGPA